MWVVDADCELGPLQARTPTHGPPCTLVWASCPPGSRVPGCVFHLNEVKVPNAVMT